MKTVIETVALPDAAEHPLVHPLDLPEARGHFRRAFVIGALTSPGLALVLAGLSWFLGESWVTPVIVFVSTAVLGWLARRYSLREAWAYIPRKRRDHDRPLPFAWLFGSALLFASLLAIGVLLVARRLGADDIDPGIRDYTFGAGAAAAILSLVVFGIASIRGRVPRRSTLFTLPPIVALAGAVAAAYPIIFGADGPGDWRTVATGGAITLVVASIAGGWRLVEERRDQPST